VEPGRLLSGLNQIAQSQKRRVSWPHKALTGATPDKPATASAAPCSAWPPVAGFVKDQLLHSALHGTAVRYAAERRKLEESIEELRQIADGRNDILAEAAGITAGYWYAWPPLSATS
jgi:hypothetical protein